MNQSVTTCKHWPISACSWSFQQSIEKIATHLEKLGISHIHLALRPIIDAGDESGLDYIKSKNLNVSCTMLDFPQEDYTTLESIKKTGGIVPDDSWEDNKALFIKAAKITQSLGVKYISLHGGFIDHNDRDIYAIICDRLKTLADISKDHDIVLLLETGQESAEDLKIFLEEVNHPNIGVNFDPANMILYDKGMPTASLKTIGKWIKHVHIKDAKKTTTTGTWGEEVPWGEGDVDAASFLATLEAIGYQGAIAIEREAGDNRFNDIQTAVQRLKDV